MRPGTVKKRPAPEGPGGHGRALFRRVSGGLGVRAVLLDDQDDPGSRDRLVHVEGDPQPFRFRSPARQRKAS